MGKMTKIQRSELIAYLKKKYDDDLIMRRKNGTDCY